MGYRAYAEDISAARARSSESTSHSDWWTSGAVRGCAVQGAAAGFFEKAHHVALFHGRPPGWCEARGRSGEVPCAGACEPGCAAALSQCAVTLVLALVLVLVFRASCHVLFPERTGRLGIRQALGLELLQNRGPNASSIDSLSRNAQHGVDEDLALDSRDVALNSQDEQLASDATDCVIRCFQRVSFGAVLIIITLLLMRSTSQTLQERPEQEKRFVMPEPLIERPQSDHHDQLEGHGIIDQEFERHGRAIDQDDFERHGLIDQAPADRRKQGSFLPPGRLPRKCYYSYTGQGLMPANSCFCQLANNEGCRSNPCNCPQGCGSHVVWRQGESSTFRNMKGATGCTSQAADALLTVPESFFRDIRYLSTWCPTGARNLLASMMLAGFNSYRAKVDTGPVRQCVHSAEHVSVGWLHVHTFCHDGWMDDLPGAAPLGWCSLMSAPEDADALAASALLWARRLYGAHDQDMPSNCSEMGCNMRGMGGRCSCNAECTAHHDCCPDYSRVCPS